MCKPYRVFLKKSLQLVEKPATCGGARRAPAAGTTRSEVVLKKEPNRPRRNIKVSSTFSHLRRAHRAQGFL